MPISTQDRLQLTNYLGRPFAIVDTPQFNASGQCGTFAKNLIENGTGKMVVNPNTVFQSTLGNFTLLGHCVPITDFNSYITHTHAGDILCFVGSDPVTTQWRPLHYVVRCNINGINVIGVNGLLTDPGSVAHLGAILTTIGAGHFVARAGHDTFLYDRVATRYVILYKIDYTLR